MADVVVSLDLGELTDFSARAILRRGLRTDARRLPARTERGHSLHRYDLLALKRYEKGTPYSDVVSDTVGILARPDLQPLLGLVVDATGVGRPVVETFRTELARLRRDRGLEVPCHAVTITAGERWSLAGRHEYRVAKTLLVSTGRAALEGGTLKFARGLPCAALLRRELLNYKVRITPSVHEVFGAESGEHDDLVTAVLLGMFVGDLPMHQMTEAGMLQPHEAAALSAERQALEEEERAALEAERTGRRREQEARQAARHADPDDPLWWGDSAPQPGDVREIVVEIASPYGMQRLVDGLADVEVEPGPRNGLWIMRCAARYGDVLAVAIERQGCGRVVAKRWVHPNESGEWVERPAAPHADPNDPIWWGGSPRPTGVMELIVEAADPALLDERVQDLAAPDVEIEIERDDSGRYVRHPSSNGVGAWRLFCGQGFGNFLALAIGKQGWGKVLSKRQL